MSSITNADAGRNVAYELMLAMLFRTQEGFTPASLKEIGASLQHNDPGALTPQQNEEVMAAAYATMIRVSDLTVSVTKATT